MTMDCAYKECLFEGFEALQLSNDQVRLMVIPALGGKIASLVHAPSGKEWLWKNPYLKYRRPNYGGSYIREFDFGGIDECFPTVGPAFYPAEPWAGTSIPDHGEVWALPWEVKTDCISKQRIILTMSCYGIRFPYHFERRITIEEGQAAVHLDYRVTNLSPFSFPFIWSIHPLIQVEPGMKLSMPGSVTKLRVDLSTHDWLGQLGTILNWPVAKRVDGTDIDLSVIQPPSLGQGVKYFTLPLKGSDPVETSLTDLTGRKLAFRFRPDEVTHIGIWMNCAGWTPLDQPPYYNLAFEPCIGGSDSLTVAANHYQEYAVLSPREERRWSLEMVLS